MNTTFPAAAIAKVSLPSALVDVVAGSTLVRATPPDIHGCCCASACGPPVIACPSSREAMARR